MSGLTQMVSKVMGNRGGGTGRAGRGGAMGGRRGSRGGNRSQDQAIGRGVRSLLRRVR